MPMESEVFCRNEFKHSTIIRIIKYLHYVEVYINYILDLAIENERSKQLILLLFVFKVEILVMSQPLFIIIDLSLKKNMDTTYFVLSVDVHAVLLMFLPALTL
ncbi:hypothetical protein [Virgibacillus sp. JSM 102003]|uniref:hypothetical protein n=1 Tax=Virgibacillus sp. JSM 102003 TaxID=1562108 RepID=UPI0035C14C8A